MTTESNVGRLLFGYLAVSCLCVQTFSQSMCHFADTCASLDIGNYGIL